MRMTGTRARRPVSVSLSWPHAARMTLSLESSPLSTNTSRTQTGNSETPQSWLLVLAHTTLLLTLGAHAQRGLLCVSLCLCLSVTALAATAFVSACNQRHLQHCFRLFLD